MAIVSCRACGFETSVGWMPAATCGLLLVPVLAGTVGGSVLAARAWGWICRRRWSFPCTQGFGL